MQTNNIVLIAREKKSKKLYKYFDTNKYDTDTDNNKV